MENHKIKCSNYGEEFTQLRRNQKNELRSLEFDVQERYDLEFFEWTEAFIKSVEDKSHWEEASIVDFKKLIIALKKIILRGFRRMNSVDIPTEVLFLDDSLEYLNKALDDLGNRGIFSGSEYCFLPDNYRLDEINDFTFQN